MLRTFERTAGRNYTENDLVQVFNALGDPTRLKLVKLLLKHRDKCVSEIAGRLGLSVSAVSQSFRILELTGLVKRQRKGQKICYSLRLDDPMVRQVVAIATNNRRKDG